MADTYCYSHNNGPVTETTLAGLRELIAKGELSAADIYCRKGAGRYDQISSMPEYAELAKKAQASRLNSQSGGSPNLTQPNLAPANSGRYASQNIPSPRTYLPPMRPVQPETRPWTPPPPVSNSSSVMQRDMTTTPAGVRRAWQSTSDDGQQQSFWQQPARPRMRFWSAVSYTLASVFLTPLLGTLLMDANHRMAQERTWRTVPMFWCGAWGLYLIGILVDKFVRGVQDWPLWAGAYCAMWFFWFFTCALPHRLFLKQQPNDIDWRADWGRPLGYGFLAFALYFCVFLLSPV